MSSQENNPTGPETPEDAQTPDPQESTDTQAAAQDPPASEPPPPTPVEQPTEDAPAPEKPKSKYRLRQRVWGQVIRLTETKATLGIGEEGLDEGVLDLIHLRDEFGNLTLSEGDGLQVYMVGLGATMKLAP